MAGLGSKRRARSFTVGRVVMARLLRARGGGGGGQRRSVPQPGCLAAMVSGAAIATGTARRPGSGERVREEKETRNTMFPAAQG